MPNDGGATRWYYEQLREQRAKELAKYFPKSVARRLSYQMQHLPDEEVQALIERHGYRKEEPDADS